MSSLKNSATFFFKLIALLSLFVLISARYVLPYAPDLGEDTRYINSLNKLDDNKYDMFFFGNSYMFTSYDPLIIKEKLNLEALHLNVGAQRLEVSLIIANHILDKNDVSYIFFDVSGPSLETPKIDAEDIWQYQTRGLQEIPLSLEKIKKVLNFYPLEKYKEYTATAISKKTGRFFRANNRLKYSKKLDSSFYKTSQKSVYFSTNGFIANRKKPVDKEIFNRSFFVKNTSKPNNDIDFRWSASLCTSMDEFLKKTSRKDIEVVFVNSIKIYSTNYKSEIIKEFTEKYNNVRFLDLNTKKNLYQFDETSFYDKTHLNYRGSIQVTHRLVDSISKWYRLQPRTIKPVALKNFNLLNRSFVLNNNEDKFVKLEFDSIPTSVIGKSLNVSLVPKDSLKLVKENIPVKIDAHDIIKSDETSILIQRLDTKLSSNDLSHIELSFYDANDTINLPAFIIN